MKHTKHNNMKYMFRKDRNMYMRMYDDAVIARRPKWTRAVVGYVYVMQINEKM